MFWFVFKVATPQGIDGTVLDELIGRITLTEIEEEDAIQSWMLERL